jgi:hypothetical protein
MKPGVAPVAQKQRQVPYYLQKPLKQWLEEGVKADIFEEVRSLGFANEPSGLICIIPNSRSVALLNNGGEFIFPFKTMNFVSIPHVAFCTTVLNSSFSERKL